MSEVTFCQRSGMDQMVRQSCFEMSGQKSGLIQAYELQAHGFQMRILLRLLVCFDQPLQIMFNVKLWTVHGKSMAWNLLQINMNLLEAKYLFNHRSVKAVSNCKAKHWSFTKTVSECVKYICELIRYLRTKS